MAKIVTFLLASRRDFGSWHYHLLLLLLLLPLPLPLRLRLLLLLLLLLLPPGSSMSSFGNVFGFGFLVLVTESAVLVTESAVLVSESAVLVTESTGFGYRISGFGYRIRRFGYRISAFGYRIIVTESDRLVTESDVDRTFQYRNRPRSGGTCACVIDSPDGDVFIYIYTVTCTQKTFRAMTNVI